MCFLWVVLMRWQWIVYLVCVTVTTNKATENRLSSVPNPRLTFEHTKPWNQTQVFGSTGARSQSLWRTINDKYSGSPCIYSLPSGYSQNERTVSIMCLFIYCIHCHSVVLLEIKPMLPVLIFKSKRVIDWLTGVIWNGSYWITIRNNHVVFRFLIA